MSRCEHVTDFGQRCVRKCEEGTRCYQHLDSNFDLESALKIGVVGQKRTGRNKQFVIFFPHDLDHVWKGPFTKEKVDRIFSRAKFVDSDVLVSPISFVPDGKVIRILRKTMILLHLIIKNPSLIDLTRFLKEVIL